MATQLLNVGADQPNGTIGDSDNPRRTPAFPYENGLIVNGGEPVQDNAKTLRGRLPER
jgi:hypothetical protein